MLSTANFTIYEQAWLGASLILALSPFCTHIFLTTYYIIVEDQLKNKCGFLFNLSIAISSIKNLEEMITVTSSAAKSFDRLEISYEKFENIVISPKDKFSFINQLLSINPSITVKLKQS